MNRANPILSELGETYSVVLGAASRSGACLDRQHREDVTLAGIAQIKRIGVLSWGYC